MKRKDESVETEFHPILITFLFEANELYRDWGSELTITSGSEASAKHSLTSLHYATPAQAADIRIWRTANVPKSVEQETALKSLAGVFCTRRGIPKDWLEVILESNHIHIEYQPKRRKEIT